MGKRSECDFCDDFTTSLPLKCRTGSVDTQSESELEQEQS